MDDDDEAVESVADGVGGPDVGGHVLVAVLRACERAVERVDADDRRDVRSHLPLDVVDQRLAVGGERQRVGDKVARRVFALLQLGSPERFAPFAEGPPAFKADIDDSALPHAMAAILPAERDVHQEIEDEETLAAFRRSPEHGQTASRQHALDAIVVAVERLEVAEADQDEAGGRRLLPVARRRRWRFRRRQHAHAKSRQFLFGTFVPASLRVSRDDVVEIAKLVGSQEADLPARSPPSRLKFSGRTFARAVRVVIDDDVEASIPGRTGNFAIIEVEPVAHIGRRPNSAMPVSAVSFPSARYRPWVPRHRG